MELTNYHLKIKSKPLLSNVSIKFYVGTINHIVGKNGVGKSLFARDLLLNKSGHLPKDISANTILISSSSNVPYDITKNDLIKLLKQKFTQSKHMDTLMEMLNINDIPNKVLIKHLSDGQKQKLKFLSFLSEDKDIVVLDEITNALDKKTINEIYYFLGNYINLNPEKIIINITHNLADLTNLNGHYFMLRDMDFVEYESRENLVDDYINL